MHKRLDQDALAEILRRIVRTANPDRIIMFGSAVEGRMGPHSDIDLLVVSHHDEDRGRVTGDIYEALHGIGQAVDVVMVTPDEVERYQDTPGLIIRTALRQGKEVYGARAPSSG